ncbi:hypothetical protein JKF63_06291 [Porcisia hertigi]|uniref:Uncharacterized protein n=1 Tax=Porcisia hertigi TaxID=2761500 RepID=A0A836LET2_9TRYP|nr:hypothetical protein JKF63_06291 [Porcisia hertigi]
MKSIRTSGKGDAVRPPYSTTPHSHRAHERLRTLSRVARDVCAMMTKGKLLGQVLFAKHKKSGLAETLLAPPPSSTLPALVPGDVLRDLAFFTQASEVSFFSTHPLLCARVFGVTPGEVFESGGVCVGASSDSGEAENGNSTSGEVIVVVGARGGRLWVWTHGDAAARVLSVPVCAAISASSSAAEVRSALMEHYQLRQFSRPSRPQRNPGDGKAQQRREEEEEARQQRLLSSVCADFQSLCARAHEEAQRLYTADQQAFLQSAPDMYVAVTKTGNSVANSPGAGASTATGAHAEPPPDDVRGAPSSFSLSRSIYTDIACHSPHAATVVLLAPHVVLGTRAIGWVGEGDIVLPDALVGQGRCLSEASLSASVVMEGTYAS